MTEIFLLPGQFYFGRAHNPIRTILGSCIAITMWNERTKIGGMCHYKLPVRSKPLSVYLDGNYGDEAIQLFIENMKHHRLKPHEMQVGVYGAGNMFKDIINDDSRSISAQNIRLANNLLPSLGFTISHKDYGGSISRRVSLDIETGEVSLETIKIDRKS